jgi:hypothetical protein
LEEAACALRCACAHNVKKNTTRHNPTNQNIPKPPELSIWQRHEEEREVDYSNFGFLLLPVVQDEDPALMTDLAAGRCLLEGREPLLLFDRPQVTSLIQGKTTNVTVDADIEEGGWVRA